MAVHKGQGLGKALMAEGLCPENCLNVELHVPASGAVFVRYEVWLDTKDVPKLQRALGAMLEEAVDGQSNTEL